jgi:Asp-tRNA(Asn)/Glu-tRNA(Gln) amidotransferase C subunit
MERIGMTKLTKAKVKRMAAESGLKLDDTRAETIASRLRAVLEELEAIPDEQLAGVEPLPVFLSGPPSPDE